MYTMFQESLNQFDILSLSSSFCGIFCGIFLTLNETNEKPNENKQKTDEKRNKSWTEKSWQRDLENGVFNWFDLEWKWNTNIP